MVKIVQQLLLMIHKKMCSVYDAEVYVEDGRDEGNRSSSAEDGYHGNLIEEGDVEGIDEMIERVEKGGNNRDNSRDYELSPEFELVKRIINISKPKQKEKVSSDDREYVK